MSTNKNFDLTDGGILRCLLSVAIPIMGTQLIQMAYNMTDMFWLGRLGRDAVAATGAAGMYMWLSMAFMLVGRMGAEIGVSQSFGAKQPHTALHFSQNACFLAAVLGVLYGAVMILARHPLIGFFHMPDAAVANDAAHYLAIVSIGCPFSFVGGALAGTFNGYGNARMSFVANACGLILNMLLDPLLIFGFGLGITGAALATLFAQIVVCLLFLAAIRANRTRPFARFSFRIRPSSTQILQILAWSTPVALESLLFTLLTMIITRFVSAFGTDAIAVSRVGSQIEALSWMVGGGFGSAVTAFVGQNYGAKRISRIKSGFRIALSAISLWGVVITLMLLFAGRFLFGIFLNDAALMDMGADYLRIQAFCQLPVCIEAVAGSMFRGMGRTVPPSAVSITGNALRVPLAFVLSTSPLGLNGIWWALTAGAILRGLWILAWYLLHARRLRDCA